jgi:U4/U6 small nuclear ribonucleoprotein PRP3
LPNLVLIEGGPRAIKKYKNLMLRRIKWDKKHVEKDSENPKETTTENEDMKESLDKKCFLVWEGT